MSKKFAQNALSQWINFTWFRIRRNWPLKLIAFAVTVILFYLAHTTPSVR